MRSRGCVILLLFVFLSSLFVPALAESEATIGEGIKALAKTASDEALPSDEVTEEATEGIEDDVEETPPAEPDSEYEVVEDTTEGDAEEAPPAEPDSEYEVVEDTTEGDAEETPPAGSESDDVADVVEDVECFHSPADEKKLTDVPERYTPLDERKHNVKGTTRWESVCKSCGATLESGEQPLDRDDAHEFDASGKCGLCGYQCLHPSYTQGRCDICGYSCPHQYEEGVCTVCGYECQHWWSGQRYDEETGIYDNVCGKCGMICTHKEFDGNHRCTTCGYTCGYSGDHHYENGECIICGYKCTYHSSSYSVYWSYSGGKGICNYCGIICSHEEFDENHRCTTCGYTCGYHGSHQYENGVCSVCGYKCPYHSPSYSNYWSQNVEKSTCNYCGMICTHEEFDENHRCTTCGYTCGHHGSHQYENGVCTICGYKCPHMTGWRYENGKGVCNVCGLICSTHDFDENGRCKICYYNCPHQYENGVCTVCGHACSHSSWQPWNDGTYKCYTCGLICRHENKTVNEISQARIGGYVQNSDGLTHGSMMYNVTYSYCPFCQRNLREVEYPGTPVNEPHSFYPDAFGNRICAYCGYGCTHTRTFRHTTTETLSCTPNDDGLTHTSVYESFVVTTCEICNYDIKLVSLGTRELTSKHYYDKDQGVCGGCGIEMEAAPQCLHENVYYHNNYSTSDGFVSEIAEDYHIYAYPVMRFAYCADCGERLETTPTGEYVYETEPHYFRDGKCGACGKEGSATPCEHPESARQTKVELSYVWGYMPYDELYHQQTVVKNLITYCDLCGKWLSSEEIEGGNEINLSEHYFVDGRYCAGCGYVKASPCEHLHTHVEHHYVNGSDYYAVADEETGTTNYLISEWEECDDCGAQLGPERRHMESGKLPKECDHANTCTDQYYYGLSKVIPGKSGHILKASEVWQSIQCWDCGSRLENDKLVATDATFFEPHEFVNGKCKVCGYTNTCEHERTEDRVSYALKRNGVSEGTETHAFLGDRVTTTVCLDCGETLHTEREIDVNATGIPHTFRDGFCTLCGEPEPGVEPTESPAVTATPTPTPTVAPSPTPAPAATPSPTPAEPDTTFEPTPEPTATPTPEQTPEPTAKPEQTTEPTITPEPSATPEPTSEPTQAPIASGGNGNSNGSSGASEAVYAPAPVPTPTPAPREMVETLLGAIETAGSGGSAASVEVIGAKEILTADEYAALKTLPAREQVLVTLSAIGMGDVVETAARGMNIALSADAQALSGSVAARLAASGMSADLAMRLAMYFPVTSITENGVTYDYFSVTLEITVDGVTTVYRYGFRYDDALGEWVFVLMNVG